MPWVTGELTTLFCVSLLGLAETTIDTLIPLVLFL